MPRERAVSRAPASARDRPAIEVELRRDLRELLDLHGVRSRQRAPDRFGHGGTRVAYPGGRLCRSWRQFNVWLEPEVAECPRQLLGAIVTAGLFQQQQHLVAR